MGRSRTSAAAQTPCCVPPLFTPDEWEHVTQSLRLSCQQSRIVGLILSGKGDKEIATDLGLSKHTVRTYLSRAFARLGVADRVGLILHVWTDLKQA